MVDSTKKNGATHAADSVQARMAGALAAIGLLLLLALVVTQWLLAGQRQAVHAISVASQQRMLGQQILKTASRLIGVGTTEARRDAVEEMRSALAELQRAHTGLKSGSDELNLPGGNSARLSLLLEQVESAHFAFADEAAKVLAASETPGAVHQAVQRLGQYESVYMKGMAEVVAGYEDELSTRIDYARWLGLALGLLALAALGLAVRKIFRPAMAGMNRSLRDRENRTDEMEKIFADGPAALFIVDATSLAIERGNRKAEAMTGYSEEELPGRPFSSCFDTRFEANKVFVLKIRAGETFDDMPVMLIDARRRAVDALASMRPVTYAGLRRYLVALTDVTRAGR